MSLNKFMHSRNTYRNPPDFSQLALKYPEFLKISKLDVNGKVHIDFKDPNSLRILTKCLLHSDFGLNVHIPEDRLVPTLPLRLNYILWIEDLMGALGTPEQVTGIDIGTGACAIYPLLGAVKNKWQMIGTETDGASYQVAQDNITENNLQSLITIKRNTTESLLEHCFTENKSVKYEFCMCNPPFYSSLQELCESRSSARPPPKNAFTGSLPELITEGGEVEFIKKLIKESTDLKDNVKIFTTMVGHKASLKELAAELRQRGVQHTHTEFCQGRTTRWGLAWTYLHTFRLQLVAPPRNESRKKNASMAFVIPQLPTITYDTESVTKQIKTILAQLSISYKLIRKKGPKISMEIKAHTNTWSNQRRKRRQLKKLESQVTKRSKGSEYEDNCSETATIVENNNIDFKLKEVSNVNNVSEEKHNTISEEISLTKKDENVTETPEISNDLPSTSRVIGMENPSPKKDAEINNLEKETGKSNGENIKENPPEVEKDIILHSLLTIGKQEDDIILDMEFLDGSAGKDGMHQVVQFIKNNWK